MSVSTLADAHTEVRTERITYKWSIKGFNLLLEDVDEKIWSPWFYSRDNREKWRLELYPRGHRKSSPQAIDFVALYLAHDSLEKTHIKAQVQMKISNSKLTLRKLSSTYKFPPQGDWGYKQFLERSKLLTTNSSDNNQITVKCIIDIPVNITTSSCDATIFDSKESPMNDDFRLLLEDPIFSDFTIIIGDEKIATHRVILARRSPVFAAMFQHEDLEENRKNEVKIENIEPDVIRGMLEFIYTDEVTNIKELARGLLEAADKYDLEKLRIMCEKTLYEGLNKDNAAEVLQLADLHHADKLKERVMKYIVDHAPRVVKSISWKKIGGNPDLLLELFNHSVLPQKKMEKIRLKMRRLRSKV